MKKKMQKSKNQKSVAIPKEVKQYEQARKKFISAMEKADKLRNSPAVKKFMKMQEAVKQPSEEDKRQREFVNLHDTFFYAWKFVSDQLWILSELSFADHGCDIPLQNLHSTFNEIDKRMDVLKKNAERTFELARIGKKEAESKTDKAA
jgi:hypothetical protein